MAIIPTGTSGLPIARSRIRPVMVVIVQIEALNTPAPA